MQRACAVFVLLFAMSAPGATRGGSLEPRYKSEFTYDEQLLEKMIRMEAEMDKWETGMNEQLGQLTSLREHIDHLIKTEDSRLELIQEVFVESRNNLTTLQSRTDGQVQQLIEKIKKEVGTTPNILFKARRVKNEKPSSGEIIVFEDVLYNQGSGYDSSSGVLTAPVGGTYLFTARLLSQRNRSYLLYFVKNAEAGTTPNILFKARRVKNVTPTNGQVIVFEDILYNHGSGYDSSSGVFTAPVGGTYLFTARLLSQSSGSVFFEINVNGNMNSNGAVYNHQGYSYASADSVVRLLPGDRVFIKSLYSNMIVNVGLLSEINSKSNEFTGVLLHV